MNQSRTVNISLKKKKTLFFRPGLLYDEYRVPGKPMHKAAEMERGRQDGYEQAGEMETAHTSDDCGADCVGAFGLCGDVCHQLQKQGA
jgi:hypothetical protein